MIVVHSKHVQAAAPSTQIQSLLKTISANSLREWVERISIPRHFVAERDQNRATARWLHDTLESFGYRVERQGPYSNVLAFPNRSFDDLILVGAHYDSVADCPGADDNGSAVAAMLGCAAACSLWRPVLPVVFAAFNREEDGLLGSHDFVESYLPRAAFKVRCAQILEMVGYASPEPGSQRLPTGLPVKISDTGDFLGLLANGRSAKVMELILRQARTHVPELPVTGLNVKFGLEKYFPVLSRSDHAPFWARKIPSVMWTDTSEFRNPNYHLPTDTPDTLNYEFLRQVTQLLTVCVIQQAEQAQERSSL